MKRMNVAIISFHYSDLYKSRKVSSDKMRLSVHKEKQTTTRICMLFT